MTAPSTTTEVAAPPVRPALTVSALRCVVLYVMVPAMAPVLGSARWLATPFVVGLLGVGTFLSARAFVRSLRAGTSAALTLLTSALLSFNLLAVVNLLA